jgi:MarR-like DNA-binding transcriptional regulator SgrR of sgrS sRNA
MIEETVAKIEQAIRRAAEADPKHRDALIRLLEQLKLEVAALPSTQGEDARSIAHFAEAAAHEAARKERSDRTMEAARHGLEESVVGFEASHPELTAIVNQISNLLAGMGI